MPVHFMLASIGLVNVIIIISVARRQEEHIFCIHVEILTFILLSCWSIFYFLLFLHSIISALKTIVSSFPREYQTQSCSYFPPLNLIKNITASYLFIQQCLKYFWFIHKFVWGILVDIKQSASPSESYMLSFL